MENKTLTIRPSEPRDYPDILRLNADNVSVLAPMDGEGIRRFADWYVRGGTIKVSLQAWSLQ